MKKCLILGFGRSGKAAYKLLEGLYDIYVLSDLENDDKDINYITIDEIVEKLPQFELTIRSPGFPSNNVYFPLIRMCSKHLISEIELGYHFLKKKKNMIIAVTGSDGKTTTLHLISDLLNSVNIKNIMLGNVGTPFCEKVQKLKNEVVLLELSSFQLEDIYDFKPDIVVLTNFRANHLDHVSDLNYYYASKKRILFNVSKNKIISTPNTYIENYINIFASKNEIYTNGESIFYRGKPIINIQELNNRHYLLIDSCLALSAVVSSFGYHNAYLKALHNFQGLKYRQEEIKYLHFTCVNDSKSTTTQALEECLKSYQNCKRIIIIGGIYKSLGIEDINFLSDDEILLFGKDRNKISELIKRETKSFSNLDEIFSYLKSIDIENKTIIFSPACSSLDQFESFEQRGKIFENKCEELNYESN